MSTALAGISNAYRILLGDDVTDDLERKLASEDVKEFFKLHMQYDQLAEKYPKSEPVSVMHADSLPRFDSMLEYSRFLHRIQQKLGMLREKPGPDLNKLVIKMIKILDKAEDNNNNNTATSSAVDPRRGMIGRSLPAVPLSMQAVEALPYSYPSFAKTYEVVVNFWDNKDYDKRLTNELNRAVRASLLNLQQHLSHTGGTAPVSDLAVAAQKYLMDHNWIRYGLEDVAEASYALANAGYEHDVTTEGDILFDSHCKVTYRFLGANLESVLRKCVFNLAKETMNGVVLAGRQPAIDVLVACSSKKVQEFAKIWLNNLHETFQQSN